MASLEEIKEKLKAHIRTKEHSKAISESKKGIIPKATYLRRNYVGENNPNFGKKWPEQSKLKHEMFFPLFLDSTHKKSLVGTPWSLAHAFLFLPG